MPSHSASRRRSSSRAAAGSHVGDDSASTAGGPSTSLLDDPKYAIAANFLTTMLHEVVIDTALLVHTQVGRQRKAEGKLHGGCPVCRTACQKSAGDEEHQIKTETEEGEDASASVPKGLEMYQNNPLLSCLVCSRQVSANRYAQHLATCVGVGKGGVARRKGKGGSGGSSAKDRMRIKTALENRKKANFQTQSSRNTPTPIARQERESMSGASDDEGSSRMSKTSSGVNQNGKRGLSPGNDSNKRAKHGTPPRGDVLHKLNSSQPFAPSALGSSLPVTGSPLNPHRSSKLSREIDPDEDDDEDAEDEADDDEDGEEEDEEEEEEEDEEDDDDDDDDDASIALGKSQNSHARASSPADTFDEDDDDSDDARSEAVSESVSFVSKHKQATTARPIERSKGSDGEYIDVESASAHSEEGDDF